MKTIKFLAPLTALSLLLALPALADSAAFNTPLAATGADADAAGYCAATFGSSSSVLAVAAYKLDPLTTFDFLVDGQLEGSGVSNKAGVLVIRFSAPDKPGFQRLDFDPRGKSVAIQQAGNPVLTGVFSGVGESSKSSVKEAANLTNLVAGSKGRASAQYVQTSSGVAVFAVSVSGVSAQPVDLLVNGQPVGTPIVINRGGAGLIRFMSPNQARGYLPLNFDPRGATIDLVQSGKTIFTGEMKARCFGPNLANRATFVLPIPAVSSPSSGTAKAKWSVNERAQRRFAVELEDVPVGSYGLAINGVSVGTIAVTNSGNETEGEIEFSSRDDDEDKLPLTFDPLGATITITSEGTTLFEGVFNPSKLAVRPMPERESSLEENLASTGLDPDAKAEASYEVDNKGRHRFKMEIEDVAPGTYTLRVGGVPRAAIRAVLINGSVEGEVEFRSVPEPRKILLNFDPRGQSLEIVAPDGSVLFNHVFGTGSSAGGHGVTEMFVTRALIAANGATGSVLATYKQETDGDRKLKIKARNLPAGAYDVSIGGTPRGTLTVVASGTQTEGELEFETNPDPGQPVLDFEVLGREIIVSQAGLTLFSRTLTAP